MTVKELIAKLEKADQDAIVILSSTGKDHQTVQQLAQVAGIVFVRDWVSTASESAEYKVPVL